MIRDGAKQIDTLELKAVFVFRLSLTLNTEVCVLHKIWIFIVPRDKPGQVTYIDSARQRSASNLASWSFYSLSLPLPITSTSSFCSYVPISTLRRLTMNAAIVCRKTVPLYHWIYCNKKFTTSSPCTAWFIIFDRMIYWQAERQTMARFVTRIHAHVGKW